MTSPSAPSTRSRRDMQNEVIRLHHEARRWSCEALKLGDHIVISVTEPSSRPGRPDELVGAPADALDVKDFVRDAPKSHVLTLEVVMRRTMRRRSGHTVIRTAVHAAAETDRPIRVVPDRTCSAWSTERRSWASSPGTTSGRLMATVPVPAPRRSLAARHDGRGRSPSWPPRASPMSCSGGHLPLAAR